MRVPTAARIWVSVSLLCAGIMLFPAFNHWVVTRTWVAVNMPISLKAGHVKADNFYVNVSTVYHIEIELEGYEYWRYPDCQDYKVIQSRWWLSRNGSVSATWKDHWDRYWDLGPDDPMSGVYLGAFRSSTGRYNLDVEILSDSTCLQPFHPRLRVYADNSDFAHGGWIRATALLVSWALVGISVAFLLVSSVAPVQTQVTHGKRFAIFDKLRAERESARRKLALMGPASILPNIGYAYGLTYLIVFLAFAPFILGKFMSSRGIPARLLRPGVIQVSTDRQTTGLLVYVDRRGSLYLNSKPVTGEGLPRALEDEFARRADWSVYVEGDPDVQYQAVVQAMDLVRSAQGKVIMLTPNMRAEAQAGHD
jgi:biopolymer transport protein ExbD